jgi:23S rRNA U2552 (ribose-2'-O)-methylase RlmE/FtsJ
VNGNARNISLNIVGNDVNFIIGIDVKNLQIRAVQLTTNNVSDSQVLSDLLNQIPSDERIDSIYTDGAYDTKLCRQVISDRHAHAVIPPRKNAKP